MSNLATHRKSETGSATPKSEIVQRLCSISRAVRQMLNIKLAPIGMIAGQDQFLLMLLENGTVSSVKAAAALGIRASTVSKMVDICEQRGWMRRSSDDDDHRRVLIGLTEEGAAMARKVQGIMADFEKEIVPFCEDVSQVCAAAAQMEAVLVKRLSRLR